MKTISNLKQKLDIARRLTIGSYIVMAATLVASGLSAGTPHSLVIISLLPLALFIPTLKKESYKGLSLLCFVILMYFVVTVDNLFSPSASFYDWIELVTECTLFIASMMFSRWKQYSLYQEG